VSYISRLRKQWNYETDVPRCGTCAEFQAPRVYLTRDSISARSKPLCKAGHFQVSANACCDKWHRKGEVVA
jgi:hypothetical protein